MSCCEDLRPLLDRFHDGELSRHARARVERHLASCPACAKELSRIASLGQELRQALEAECREVDFSGFTERVMQGVARERPLPLGQRLRLWLGETLRVYRPVWLASLAAAAAAVLVIALWPASPATGLSGEKAPPVPAVANNDAPPPEGPQVIIDRMEYAGERSMIFSVSRNNTTVIWLYDMNRVHPQKSEGDDL